MAAVGASLGSKAQLRSRGERPARANGITRSLEAAQDQAPRRPC